MPAGPANPTPTPRERPLSFAAAMIHALRNGWKTQTRRPIYPQPSRVKDGQLLREDGKVISCPFGITGDRLWVRERFAFENDDSGPVIYAADDPRRMRFQQSQFMPRAVSRFLLGIKSIRAQRLQKITESDARVEGFDPSLAIPARKWFAELWDSLAPGEGLMWNDNPWVWAVEFEVLHPAPHVHAGLPEKSRARGGRSATPDEMKQLADHLRKHPM